jgi:ABC-type branched-subunit amino acid transport system ATPase component
MTPSLLDVEQLSVSFGGSKAVDGLSLKVDAGKLVGLIGPNGAGKTTTIDAITGFVPCTGSVDFDGSTLVKVKGRRLHTVSPTRRARLGLARTWQGAELFVDLSVLDNLRVAGERVPDAELRTMLADLGIDEFAESTVGALSHGQRKLVGVARALAARPKLICMDEPAAGLDTAESLSLGRRIRDIVDRGTAVLLIDHDMGLVLSICDYIYVLDFGRLIAEGTAAQIRTDDRVIEAYLGRRHREQVESERAQ